MRRVKRLYCMLVGHKPWRIASNGALFTEGHRFNHRFNGNVLYCPRCRETRYLV